MSRLRNEVNALLSGFKKGDKTKFKDLYDKTFHHLKGLALRYALDKNDWEDILVETYFRITKYINSFDLSKDGYNWICKILQNVTNDINSKYFVYVDEAACENIACIDNNIDERSALMVEIMKLPESDRKLLYMKFWEDLSYAEIAEIVNGKKSTIHKHVLALLKIIENNLKM